MFIFTDFLYESICCGFSFELHQQVDAILMGTHNIRLYKEVDKNYTGYNLKTMELLDCALIGVCAVIRSWVCHIKMVKARRLCAMKYHTIMKFASGAYEPGTL